MLRAALALFLLAGVAARAAETRVALRAGEHDGRSRLVLDWPGRPTYRVEQQGDRLLLRLPPGMAPEEVLRTLPRRLQGMALSPEGLVLTLRPGVRVRHFTMDNRVVLDLTEGEAAPARAAEPARGAPRATPERPAPRAEAARPAAPVLRLPPPGRAAEPDADPVLAALPDETPVQQPLPAPAAAAPPVVVPTPARPVAAPVPTLAAPAPPAAAAPAPPPVAAAPPSAAPPPAPPPAAPPVAAAPPPAAAAATEPAPVAAPPAVLAPMGALALRLLPQPGGAPPALLLPFTEPAGAAMLRRGEALLLAFATPQPLDLTALRAHPLFAPAEALLVPGGVVLRLPLAAPAALRVRREGPGWLVQVLRGDERRSPEAEPRALAPELLDGNPPRFALRTARPGPVLALTDPETGLPLLLGTVQEAPQAVPVARRLAEFELPPTLLGLAVLAQADKVTVAPLNDRFIIGAGAGARLALDPAAAAPEPGARGMTRSFELPAGPVAQLLRRFQGQQSGIAAAPPLARAPARREAAETLLALGLAAEAQAMAGLALAEDPAAAQDPRVVAAAAAAALLAGRLAEARPLREAGLPDSDEMTLWRAALAAAEGQPEQAAPGFAATLPLLLDYPAPLRERLLPLAAEALAEAQDRPALTRLLAAQPEHALPLPRAMLAEAEGRTDDALAAYDRAAAGANRRARAVALRRGNDLRLAAGRIDAAAAARALDAALFAWRGDGVELAARRRLAQLRLLAKQPREALALLQETAEVFPDQAVALREPMVEALLVALAEELPLAAVTLHDSHVELLRGSPRAEEAAMLLADRLTALDLTDRAAALLARAADRVTEPARRASLGVRLASLKLGEGDAAAALAALESTRADGLPEALSRERVVLAARAEARRNNLDKAREGLATLGEAGVAPLAELLAEAQDWPGAAAAGARLVAALPASGALDAAQQRLLLRQAALLALAGDESGLAALRAQAPRLAGSPLAEGFAALTAEQLRGLGDLPRLAREQQLFRNLPQRLEALRAGGPVTR